MRGGKIGSSGSPEGGGQRPIPRPDVAQLLGELKAQREDILHKNQRLEQMQNELDRAVSRYADLYESVPLPYCTLDAFGVIFEVNGAFAKLLQREPKRLVGHPFIRNVVEQDRGIFFGHMRRCRRESNARTPVRLLREGDILAVELVSHGIPRTMEEAARFRTALIDLTERRRAEEAGAASERERRRAEAQKEASRATDEARDRFLAELSHELRTPLTPILATVTSLRARSDISHSLRASLEMVQRNVEIEARLIDDLLDVSRIAGDRINLELVPIDTHRTFREVVANLASEIEKSRVTLKTELGARESWVLGDELRLNQILWNLVVNALRNTPPGGEIVIATANLGDDLRIIVRDTGVGIEPERLEEIFSPFSKEQPAQRGKTGLGLGLGLAIVKGLVKAHQGRIQAVSRGKGQGSAFVVELPSAAAPAEQAAAIRRDVAKAPPSSGIRVLLVEDHGDTRAAVETLLKIHGYQVKLASDIPSAVEAAQEEFDVLVCDIGLPNGSGLELLRQIREEKPVKAIALSGYGSPRDLELAAAAGFSLHLTKPVGAERLLEAIETLLGTGASA